MNKVIITYSEISLKITMQVLYRYNPLTKAFIKHFPMFSILEDPSVSLIVVITSIITVE